MPLQISLHAAAKWYENAKKQWQESCSLHRAMVVVAPLEFSPPPQSALLREEVERAGRYHFLKDKRSYELGHKITRFLLEADQPVQSFQTEDRGKPYLAGAVPFNITHSGGLVGVALSSQGPLGVDIEYARDNRDSDGLISHVCHEHERRYLTSKPEDERQKRFYTCWTRKEALLKASGAGLSNDLTAMNTQLDVAHPRVSAIEAGTSEDVQLIDFNCGWQGYSASIALPVHIRDLLVLSPFHSQRLHLPDLTRQNQPEPRAAFA